MEQQHGLQQANIADLPLSDTPARCMKGFVSDATSPEVQAVWIRRGDRLGLVLQGLSATISRLWRRESHLSSRQPAE